MKQFWPTVVVLALAFGVLAQGQPTPNDTAAGVNQPALGSSGSSASSMDPRSMPYPHQFPAHDPHRRQQQSIHFSFQPAPNQMPPGPENPSGQQQTQSAPPTVHADLTKLATGDQQNLIINPADIQFSVPDVPDSVSAKIIEQIRKQLGNKPVTIGELNNKFVSFTAEIPGVLINRTVLTNVEEQTVVDENKLTRTTTYTSPGTSSGYQNPAKVEVTYQSQPQIKSYPYNPAAAASQGATRDPKPYQKSYSEPSYQYTVPSYAAYDTTYSQKPLEYAQSYQQPSYQQQESYQKPKESYEKPKEYSQSYQQPSYQKQDSYQSPKQESYEKQNEYKQQSYQQSNYQESYEKPKEYTQQSYQQPSYQQQESYQKPKESYEKPKEYSQQSYQQPSYQKQEPYQKPVESYEKPKEYSQPQTYQQQSSYQKQESYSGPKESSYQQQQQQPTYKEEPKVIYKYIEVCSYPAQNHYQQPAGASYQQKPQEYQQKVPEYSQKAQEYPTSSSPYAAIAQNLASINLGSYGSDLTKSSHEAESSVQDGYTSMQEGHQKMAEVYAKIHEKMAQLEELQANARQMQDQTNSGYGLLKIPPMPAYTPLKMPTFPMYGTGYSSGPSYPQPSYAVRYQKPKPYEAPASYASAHLKYPQDGNKVNISYRKVEENIQTNKTGRGY